MSISYDEFLQNLEAANLLDMAELREWLDALPDQQQPADGTALAHLLVKENKLTPYQAQVIYRGKGNNLTLGNYVIQEKLGQGGMGMVFRAQHRKMKREVALKVVSAKLASKPDTMSRFQREVEAAAKLHHPNIVVAFDADDYEGTFFLVMEVVEGKDLSSIVKKKGPVKISQAVDLIVQSARGLQYAHEQGVIHRDIKPSNLLLDKSGTVKILDMGLARIEAEVEQTELTNTGMVMGTIDYMAPEQAVSTKHVDARSDIYSLGCSLWYLLAGKSTYDGDTAMAKLLAHRDQPIPSLLEARDDATPELQGIFEKMVAKRVEDRYASMKEVIADLEKFQSGDPSLSGILKKSSTEEFVEGNLQNFLAGLNDDETSPAATRVSKGPKTKQRRVGAAEATRLAGTEDVGTDPNSFTLPANATGKTRAIVPAKTLWWQNRKIQAAMGGGVALLILLVVMFSGDDAPPPKNPPPEMNQTAAAVPENGSVESTEQEVASATGGTNAESTNGQTKPGDPVQSFVPDLGKGEPTKPGAKMSQTASAANAKPTEPTEGKWVDVFASVKNPIIDPADSWKPVPGGYRCDSQQGDPPSLELPLDLPHKFQLRWEMKHGGSKVFIGWRALEFPVDNHAMVFAFDTADKDVVATGLHETAKYSHVIYNPNSYKKFLGAKDDFKQFVLTVTYDDPKIFVQLSMEGETIYDSTGPLEEWEKKQGRIHQGLRFISIPELFWEIRNLQLRDLSGESQSTEPEPSPATPAEPEPSVPKPAEPSPHALKIELDGKPPRPEKWPFDEKKAQRLQQRWAKHLSLETEIENSLGMKFKLIPPGEFQMGVTKEQLDFLLGAYDQKAEPLNDAFPQLNTTIAEPYFLGTTEVTQQQFQDVMSVNPSTVQPAGANSGHLKGKDNLKLPVDAVSWLQAAEFCNRLSEQEQLVPCYRKVGDSYELQQGTGYRLPSESEWEFACRAGTSNLLWFGDPPVNPKAISAKGPLMYAAEWVGRHECCATSNVNDTPVYGGTFPANAYGLHDMLGNYQEWCHDWFTPFENRTPAGTNTGWFGPSAGTGRVIKGANFRVALPTMVNPYRAALGEDLGSEYVGFRVLRVIPLQAEETIPETKPATPAKPTNAKTSQWELKPEVKGREPRLEKWPFSPAAAQKSQERWAKHLSLETDYENSIGMKFKLIPPGEFQMGITQDRLQFLLQNFEQAEELKESFPPLETVISLPFYLGATEVTQQQFLDITGKNPSRHHPDDQYHKINLSGKDHLRLPVDSITWRTAVEFCNLLSQREALTPCYRKVGESYELQSGTGYRLPAEAEWEFACRAGSQGLFWFGDPSLVGIENRSQYQNACAKWIGQFECSAHSIRNNSPSYPASHSANPFGLHDMHGSFRELCHNWFFSFADHAQNKQEFSDIFGPATGTGRVTKGGFYQEGGFNMPGLTSPRRMTLPEDQPGDGYTSFRVVRVIPYDPTEEKK